MRLPHTGLRETPAHVHAQVGGPVHVSTVLQRGGIRERLADALCAELGLTGRWVGAGSLVTGLSWVYSWGSPKEARGGLQGRRSWVKGL